MLCSLQYKGVESVMIYLPYGKSGWGEKQGG